MASTPPSLGEESITQFYIEAHRIATEAQFIIGSLPNAERPAVQRIVRQLQVIYGIMLRIDDPLSNPEEIEQLTAYVVQLLSPLEEFLSNPPPPASSFVPRQSTGVQGRPSYALNLNRAQELHKLGNSWKDVAEALGVARKTLYNHLRRAGLTSIRPETSDLSDDELDDVVAEISLSHPFSGVDIIIGHLKARAIFIPRERAQASLRRVDPIGVLIRSEIVSLAIFSFSHSHGFLDGQASSNDVSTKFVALMPFGTLTAMRSSSHGASISMAALTASRGSSSILSAAPTNELLLLPPSSFLPFRSMGGLVEPAEIMVQRTTMWNGS